MSQFILAVDQGTTSTRAIIFSSDGKPVAQHQITMQQYYPQAGWVEQNPEEMWLNTLECCRQALQEAQLHAQNIAAMGITNQRETTIIWDKKTGQPIYPAIVWQDRRTSDLCKQLSQEKISANLQAKTGLLLDPYFSATKIMWLLENIPDARKRAENGELLFGTVDSFLLWRFTNGKVHATDATNASRTLLYNIKTQQWDEEILKAFNIPEIMLPTVLDSNAFFGELAAEFFGHAIPITAIAGDQQAATIGQACFIPGMIKSTYGTGCFMLLNTGAEMIQSKNKLLTTIAYRINGEVTYGLEGSIFSAGVIVKWLRDKLKLIRTAEETENLAASVTDTDGVYFIPAFTGLGAPYWNPDVRASIMNLTQNSSAEHLVRAALESVVYQSRDLLDVMHADSGIDFQELRVDGGMANNNWLLQFLADILNLKIERPTYTETTALGVAYLAGLQVGIYKSLSDISHLWQVSKKFVPILNANKREDLYAGWKKSIAKVS